MKNETLGSNRGFSSFMPISHENWLALKDNSLKLEELKVGAQYQIVSGSEYKKSKTHKLVQVRKVDQIHLIECTPQKLVFEGRESKITYFESTFSKLAIFAANHQVTIK